MLLSVVNVHGGDIELWMLTVMCFFGITLLMLQVWKSGERGSI